MVDIGHGPKVTPTGSPTVAINWPAETRDNNYSEWQEDAAWSRWRRSGRDNWRSWHESGAQSEYNYGAPSGSTYDSHRQYVYARSEVAWPTEPTGDEQYNWFWSTPHEEVPRPVQLRTALNGTVVNRAGDRVDEFGRVTNARRKQGSGSKSKHDERKLMQAQRAQRQSSAARNTPGAAPVRSAIQEVAYSRMQASNSQTASHSGRGASPTASHSGRGTAGEDRSAVTDTDPASMANWAQRYSQPKKWADIQSQADDRSQAAAPPDKWWN